MPRQRMDALTSLRFFAAITIVLFHMMGRWGLPSARDAGLHLGVAVDLFFVLSGFVLSYTYREVRSPQDIARIIAYRVARIWPLHIVMLGLFFALVYTPGHPMHDLVKVGASAILVQSWVGDYTYTFAGNAVSWTLSVELFFYVLFPFMVMMSSRSIIVLTIAIAAATTVWAQHAPIVGDMTIGGVDRGAIMRTHPGAFFALFAAGVLLARLYLSRPSWAFAGRTATAMEVIAVSLATIFLVWNHDIGTWAIQQLGVRGPQAFLVRHSLGILFFAPLIFVCAVGRGAVSGWLGNRTLVMLGEASFAMYLSHQILLLAGVWAGYAHPATAAVFVAVVVAFSIALFRFVEKPANRAAREWIDAALPKRAAA